LLILLADLCTTVWATLLAMATRAQLVEALLEFPAPDRAEAARALLESLDGEDEPVDVEAAWRDEIAGRVQGIESGAVELEDGATAMSRLRTRARIRLERRGS
jgi:putative addiction module component